MIRFLIGVLIGVGIAFLVHWTIYIEQIIEKTTKELSREPVERTV
jgi:hypothetical protein